MKEYKISFNTGSVIEHVTIIGVLMTVYVVCKGLELSGFIIRNITEIETDDIKIEELKYDLIDNRNYYDNKIKNGEDTDINKGKYYAFDSILDYIKGKGY